MADGSSLYAEPRDVAGVEDCFFYTSMDLPGVGFVPGLWDLRGREDEYLGRPELSGKRILEIGPASGHLTMYLESRGGEVVAVEIDPERDWDIVPQHALDLEDTRVRRKAIMQRLRNSFWLAHRVHGSAARIHYGTGYMLPAELGRFQVATLAAVLLHTRNPLAIVEQCARLVDEALIIVDRHVPELDGAPVCRLVPTPENGIWDTWWEFSPELFVQFAAVLGFTDAKVTFHRQQARSDPEVERTAPSDVFTVVAFRPGASHEP
jgi:hypothetical protein